MGATGAVNTRNGGATNSTTTQRLLDQQKARDAEAKKKAAAEAAAKAEADKKAKAEADAAAKAEAAKQAKIKEQSNPLFGLSDQEIQEYAQREQTKARYGSEFSYLDPTFQWSPEQQASSVAGQAKADPNAVNAQWLGLGQSSKFANQDLSFMSPDMQQQVYNRAMGLTGSSGGLTFDDGSRQGEQYGNLRDIIAGGGANSIEMAQRQGARADSESWLRGQREADMQDYAERGLTGSGMELQTLAMDRQAAAGRNSLADLQTSAALEARRMDAIKNAGGLATDMRGQTIDEQALVDKSRTTGLSYATDIANTMRDQSREEAVANQNAKQAGLNSYNDVAESLRTNSFDEAFKTGGAIDDVNKFNTDTINGAKQDNVQHLRDARETQQKNSLDKWKTLLNNGTLTASQIMQMDQKDNIFGHAQAQDLGISDSDAFNKYLNAYNQAKVDASNPSGVLKAQQTTNGYMGEAGAVGGKVVDEIIKAYTGGGAIDAVGGATQGPTKKKEEDD